MNESVNAVSNYTVSEQVIQTIECSHVDFVKRKIRFSKRLRYFRRRLVVVRFEEKATRCNLVEHFI